MINENYYYVSPTDIKQLNYCKRFIFYMKCLNIPEQIKNRFKVQKGKELHERKIIENKNYLRKRLAVSEKKINVEVYSKKHEIKGIIDELLFLEDNTCAIIDYKYAKYENVIYDTYKTQMTMYALMCEETFNMLVPKTYLVFTLSDNYLYELKISDKMREKVINDIEEYKKIVKGYFPTKTKHKKRCCDCFYKKICI
jgi:CRISPR-associated exonuclease Cas4